MKEVMMCAQKLAEAILNSDVYQHMHTLEEQVTQDEDATKAIAAYMEKRTAVEQAMRKPDIDPTQLAEAAQELEDVQQAMNDCPIIRDMRDAQKKYQDMMDNVNRILRLVLTELALSVFICLLYHFYRLGLTDTDQCHPGNIPSGT